MSHTNVLPEDAAPIADAPAPADCLADPPRPPAVEPSTPPTHRRAGLLGRLRDERGEGVISAAIAVLIMAFIGVAAFVAYRGIMGSVTEKTNQCVDVYVSNGSGCD
jgi:hypothetical protein